ncbi:unnamed protein product, partial [Tuber aestivum]
HQTKHTLDGNLCFTLLARLPAEPEILYTTANNLSDPTHVPVTVVRGKGLGAFSLDSVALSTVHTIPNPSTALYSPCSFKKSACPCKEVKSHREKVPPIPSTAFYPPPSLRTGVR